ncbi:MAG TPA: M20 family metallopeptidase [Chloroflexia bacterium]|jgi:amidohydrolase
MADIQALKEKVQREIDEIAPMLIECSDWMADNPEIGLQEHQASARLASMLEASGAEVERGIAELPTAFRAALAGSSSGGPTVAILAEYDALPKVGHGCGHNIIGNAAIGAGMALSRLGQHGELGDLPGRVVVIGTPAEESAVPNAGGKIVILEHGYFDDVDAAIMVHPFTYDHIAPSTMTAYGIDFEFHGKAAHAAFDPEHGINALDAVIQTFVNIGLLRQQVRSEARIHGVITHGGDAPNIIPSYAACRVRVRSSDLGYAQELKRRVIACAEGAATATGAKLEWHEYVKPYLSYLPNNVLGGVLRANMEAIGRTVGYAEEVSASTDFGNISQVIPTAYAQFGICGEDVGWHSREVAAATKTERGHDALIAAAKTLAMSTLDLLSDPDLIAKSKQEHRAAVGSIPKHE